MRKLPEKHDSNGFYPNDYNTVELLEYICAYRSNHSSDENSNEISVDLLISPNMFGILYHQDRSSLELSAKQYEQDDYIQSCVQALELDADKFFYYVLWASYSASNFDSLHLTDNLQSGKIRSMVALLHDMVEKDCDALKERTSLCTLTVSEGRKGGKAETIDNPLALRLILHALERYITENEDELITLDFRTHPGNLIESYVTDITEKRYWFYMLIESFIIEDAERRGKAIRGVINKDTFISRLAICIGLADTQYLDGGITSTISTVKKYYRDGKRIWVP